MGNLLRVQCEDIALLNRVLCGYLIKLLSAGTTKKNDSIINKNIKCKCTVIFHLSTVTLRECQLSSALIFV